MKRLPAMLGALLAAVGIAGLFLLVLSAQAAPSVRSNATITVTTSDDIIADDGVCSLREAIEAANTNKSVGGCQAGEEGSAFSGDTITFAIPGEGPHTISIQSPLPELSSLIVIDGLSQAGASCVDGIASPTIALDGSASAAASGLFIGTDGGRSEIRGLSINRFALHGIHIQGDPFLSVTVRCNLLGIDVTGERATNGGNGIYIDNSGSNRIQENTIGGNGGHGILIEGSEATDNQLEGNRIGTNAEGDDLGNGGDGIRAQNSGPQVIGGTYGNEGFCCVGNTIAFNRGGGVVVSAQDSISWEKGIRGNRIYNNVGLGIDLENDGVTPNDEGDIDGEGRANRLQNFPVIAAATMAGGRLAITGTLNSRASESYYIDFFSSDLCDPSGHGEGEHFLGAEQVSIDTTGMVTFTVIFSGTAAGLVHDGNAITSTASDLSGNTSEFSKCIAATAIGEETGSERLFLPLLQQ